MVPYELTISRSGETYTFIGRFRVDGRRGGPLAPVSNAYVARAERDCLLKMVDAINRRGHPATREEILAIGRFIDERVLSDRVRQTLRGMETSILILTDDPRIPWELAGVVGDGDAATCIGERVAVGRCLMADSDRTAPTMIGEAEGQPRALVIADPLGELKEAQQEAATLSAKLGEIGWKVDSISGRQATYEQICQALTSGRYAVVHFCCDVEAHHTGGAIPTATPDAPLAAGTLRRLNLGVQIVYLNACGSAVHDHSQSQAEGIPPLVAGMAHAFIEAGAIGVVGSVWKIEDRSSRVFAERFYSAVLGGASLGTALLNGKKLSLNRADGADDALEPGTAASFVLYGDPDLGIARPQEVAAPTSSWPPGGILDAPATRVLRRAAAAAIRASSGLTSLHLGWALLSDNDSPLVTWMRECGHPVGNVRSVAGGLIDIPEEPGWEDEVVLREPHLSPTITGIWEWAESAGDEQPISLGQLAERFAATPCMFREVLKWLCVDLELYPETQPPLPQSAELQRALTSAAETARWNDGVISSMHLFLGILETGGGPVEGWLRRSGIDPMTVEDRLRTQLLRGDPNMSVKEERLSTNTQRILSTARELARDAGRSEVLVHDVVDAAADLTAGAFGHFLEDIGYGQALPVQRGGATPPAVEAGLTPEADRLLDRAAQCAEACGHAVIGTPHVLAAALHESDLLRSIIARQADPDEVIDRTLEALGAPGGSNPFDTPADARGIPLSPNFQAALVRAQRRGSRGGKLGVSDIVISILTQATGKAAVVLQTLGIEPYDVVREIESEP